MKWKNTVFSEGLSGIVTFRPKSKTGTERDFYKLLFSCEMKRALTDSDREDRMCCFLPIINEGESMTESNVVTVWTLFFGDQLRKQECPMRDGLIDLSRLVRTTVEQGGLAVRVAPQAVAFNHLFLFEGLLPWGMGTGVKVCPIDGMEGGKHVVDLSVPKCSAKPVAANDFSPIGEVSFRGERGEEMVQTVFLQMVTVPKKEYRLILLTFKDRSLAPWWRLVRSSKKELVVETANSY